MVIYHTTADFDLAASLQKSLNRKECTEDEDIFSLSPLSSPGTTPPTSPRQTSIRLPDPNVCSTETLCTEDEDIFSLSPLSSPGTTPPTSPRQTSIRLPDPDVCNAETLAPDTALDRYDSDVAFERCDSDAGALTDTNAHSDPAEARKAKLRKNKHANRKRKRQKKKDEIFGHCDIPKNTGRKYIDSATHLPIPMKFISQANVTQTAYVAYNDHSSRRKKHKLEELVGPNSKLKLVEWDGVTPGHIIDGDDYIVGILAGHPADEDWQQLHQNASAALEESRPLCSPIPRKQRIHRRGDTPALRCGMSHGGGQACPSNVKNTPEDTEVLRRLNSMEPFKRLAGFASSVFASQAPKLYDHYVDKLGSLFAKHPELNRTFTSSVFTAASYNLGPRTICFRHKDYANLPFGFCAITALGSYDPTKGGHLVLWDLGLVIEFPPGSTILIPSAIVAHSNVKVAQDATRYSFTQYTAGALFRWVDNKYMPQEEYFASLTREELEEVKKDRSERWSFGMSLLPKVTRNSSSTAA